MATGKQRVEEIARHKELYKNVLGLELDLDNPKDFNEKIHWLILNYYGEKEGKLADKDYVKGYVENLKIKDLKIPRTLAKYRSVDEINLDELPNQFVLKCNHFSGDVFICKDKKTFDFDLAKYQLSKVLEKDFADINLEYHYSFIKPLIIAEEYLSDGVHKNPVDYKFYCFDGKVESVLVCSNRENKLKLNDFDLDWNELNYTTLEYRSEEVLKKPRNYENMIYIAEQLSKGIPFVRVDLYEIGNDIYFGEYTFTPGAGIICYYKQDALDYLGDKIDLKVLSR